MLRKPFDKGIKCTGFPRLARTLESTRASKFEIPKQRLEHHRMLAFMPKHPGTMGTSLPDRQVSQHLLPDDLFLQAGQQRFRFSQIYTDSFHPFGFPFQASQLLNKLTRLSLGN
jgi:hypothetical protein